MKKMKSTASPAVLGFTFLSAFLVSSFLPSPVRPADWTSAYAGLGRTSYLAEETASPPFALLWEFEAPQPVKGGPIVSGALGYVYVASPTLDVWALKLADGSPAWSHTEPRRANEVRCYDALSGALRWTRFVDGALIHTPQVGQTAVYVATSTGALYAFNQPDGAERWRVSLEAPVTLPASDGALVVVGSGTALVGLNAADGGEAFRAELGAPPVSHPVLAADGVYVALPQAVAAFGRDGTERWRVRLDRPAQAPVAVTAAGVLAASVDGSVRLFALADGSRVWESLLAGTPNCVSGASNVAYVGTRQGTLVGLSLADGAKLWSARLGAQPVDGIGISGGRVVVSQGKQVRAFLPAPEAPRDVAVRAPSGGSGPVIVTWSAAAANGSPVTGYRVWRRRAAEWVPVGLAPAPPFADSTLPGTVGYAVSAIAANGAESARSEEVLLAHGEPLLRRLNVGPVPLDPRTQALTVTFELRAAARVVWRVEDAEGKPVTADASAVLAAGPGSFAWDGRDRLGGPAAPGVYRVWLAAEAAGETDTDVRGFAVSWSAAPVASSGPAFGNPQGWGAAGAGAAPEPAPAAGGGESGGDRSDHGVRDRGHGEGRDGAGQGRGRGYPHADR